MNSLSRISSWLRGILPALLVLTVVGCRGDQGPARYEVSGTVVYNGKPVPVGEVDFQPDAERGNTGPGSIALIKDGRYRTDPKKGVLGGPYLVRIMGFDGVPVGESSDGKALFPPYDIKVVFPTQDTTHDFNVPASTTRHGPQ